MYFLIKTKAVNIKPIKNAMAPHIPKKCIGALPNLDIKIMLSKSNGPLTKRLNPNLVTPNLRA